MIRFLHTLLILAGFAAAVQGQDPRFSQFYRAPLQLNPAMIGSFEGKARFNVNYRDLYSSILKDQPFRTLGASFDMRQRMVQNDYLGIGFTLQRDQAGASQLNRTQGNIGLSFMKQLGGSRYATDEQYLIAGAQLGFGQRSFSWQKLWFSNQYDVLNGRVNFDAPSGEEFDRQYSNLYLDFNAGVLWYAIFGENMSIYAGGALHHINAPNISFLEAGEDRLYRKWVAHAGGELPIAGGLSLLPAAAVMLQGPAVSATFGGNFRYTNHEWKELALRAGAWYHLSHQYPALGGDAVIVSMFLELERWTLGLSYDITVSQLTAANNSRGALELSLAYFLPEQQRYRVACPKY
jgi:type IX secretion system PorP/SprF family membrane protein